MRRDKWSTMCSSVAKKWSKEDREKERKKPWSMPLLINFSKLIFLAQFYRERARARARRSVWRARFLYFANYVNISISTLLPIAHYLRLLPANGAESIYFFFATFRANSKPVVIVARLFVRFLFANWIFRGKCRLLTERTRKKNCAWVCAWEMASKTERVKRNDKINM